MGRCITVTELEAFGLTPQSNASDASILIESLASEFNKHISTRGTDAKAQLLAAYGYARMASKEEALIIADNLHTKTYKKQTLQRGRRTFLVFLEATRHPSMDEVSTDDIMDLYAKDPREHMSYLVSFLSYILPTHCNEFLSLYMSKNKERRAAILKIGTGRKVESCIAHSTACQLRIPQSHPYGLRSTSAPSGLQTRKTRDVGRGTLCTITSSQQL